MFNFSNGLYSVESVTNGHPDKICDQISDAILDACLTQDPYSRVAVESFGGHGLLVVGGEVTTTAKVDYEAVARKIYPYICHTDELKIIVNIVEQSPDIAKGVNSDGAGDQGIMYGYATNETKAFLPTGVVLVQALAKQLEIIRTTGVLSWLRPDGKTQATIENGIIKKILVSTQHAKDVTQDVVRAGVIEHI